jgi:hypothetical protein
MRIFSLQTLRPQRAQGLAENERAGSAQAITPREWGALLAAFALSRLAYAAAGVRFDTSPMTWFWQFVDPVLLRTGLLESVFYLHSQPPAFNFLVGAALALPGEWSSRALHALYLLLGLCLGACLLALQQRMGVRRGVRLPLTCLLLASPAVVLYENHLFYTFPELALLAGSALALHRYLDRGRGRDLLLAFACMTGLVLTHSLFHLGWALLVVVGLAAVSPGRRRLVLASAAATVGFAVLWYLRAWVLFGSFSASSWFGMSLAKTFLSQVPPAERPAVASGTILEVAPFLPLENYAGRVPMPPATGEAVLDQVSKSNGDPNLHHLAYVEIGRQYQQATMAAIRRRPGYYLRAVGSAFLFYFQAGDNNPFLGENRQRILPFVLTVDRLTLGQAEQAYARTGPRDEAWVLFAVLPCLFVFGLTRARRAWRSDRTLALTLAYMLLTITFVTVAGNATEVVENNRFRFLLEPYFLVFLGLSLESVLRRRHLPRAYDYFRESR